MLDISPERGADCRGHLDNQAVNLLVSVWMTMHYLQNLNPISMQTLIIFIVKFLKTSRKASIFPIIYQNLKLITFNCSYIAHYTRERLPSIFVNNNIIMSGQLQSPIFERT